MVTYRLLSITLLVLVIWQGVIWWRVSVQYWLLSERRRLPSRPSGALRAPTERSPCPCCATEATQAPQSPPLPPPPIEHRRGRRRSVDTHRHYCPNPACRYYGWLGLGNIVANGHPNGGRWRQLKCIICGKTFLETVGTPFYRCATPVETIVRALTALAEGMGIRQVARLFQVDPNTVLTWLTQASQHIEAISRYMVHTLHLSQVQMDELCALLSQVQSAPEAAEAVLARWPRRRHRFWLWAAIDPISKLLLAVVVGDRSLTTAQMLVHAVVQVLAKGCVPLFVSDQLAHYAVALLTHFGQWVTIPRRGTCGKHPKPRWMPLPTLQYAQVVKRRVSGRVVAVTHRVVYGGAAQVQTALEMCGWQINTAFIERINNAFRSHVAALGRRVIALAKTMDGLRSQTILFQGYYNFCLPHAALRLPLPEPLPTRGNGSPKKWQQRTPAMAAGITDHIWTLQELLLFRVPPWQQEVTV